MRLAFGDRRISGTLRVGSPNLASPRWALAACEDAGGRGLSVEEVATEKGEVSRRLLIGVLISAVFVSVLNTSMVNVVIPVIGSDYGVTEAQVGWVITGYLLTYAVGIPLYGRAADVFSIRRAFMVGLIAFAAGSLICAWAPASVRSSSGESCRVLAGAAIPALASVSVTRVLPSRRAGGRRWVLSSPVLASGLLLAPFSAALLVRWRAGTICSSGPSF